MTDNVENMVIEWMRRLDTKMDKVISDMTDVKQRLNRIEVGQAKQYHESADHYLADAAQNGRYDLIMDRMDRIERRLELRDGL